MKHISIHGNPRDGYTAMVYSLVPNNHAPDANSTDIDKLTTSADWLKRREFASLEEAIEAVKECSVWMSLEL